MTALWFAVEEHRPDAKGDVRRSPAVLFAIDVTKTEWHETFQYGENWVQAQDPLSSSYKQALHKSGKDSRMFRLFSALPDERMKAQEGFFLGSAIPKQHKAPGVLGINPIGPAPGAAQLGKLLSTERGKGRPANVPFCAIVIPATTKDKLRDPLKRTYNRRRRVLFPDVDGFREALVRGQLD